MKTTMDIPDAMYRAIKSRSAGEGLSVRHVTLMLYGDWLATPNWKPQAKAMTLKEDAILKPKRLKGFGIAGKYVRKDVPHDMESIRQSISAGCRREYAEMAIRRGFV